MTGETTDMMEPEDVLRDNDVDLEAKLAKVEAAIVDLQVTRGEVDERRDALTDILQDLRVRRGRLRKALGIVEHKGAKRK